MLPLPAAPSGPISILLTHDRDPSRPGWYPMFPNDRWADPAAELTPPPAASSGDGSAASAHG